MSKLLFSYKNFFDKYYRFFLIGFCIIMVTIFFIPIYGVINTPGFAERQILTSLQHLLFFPETMEILHSWKSELGILFYVYIALPILDWLLYLLPIVGYLHLCFKNKRSSIALLILPIPYFILKLINLFRFQSNSSIIIPHIGFYLILLLIIIPALYLIADKVSKAPPKPRKPTKAERRAALEAEVERLKSK